MSVQTSREGKMLNSWLGDVFTKRFLASKNVVVVSEGDYLNRLKICIRSLILIPFYVLLVGLFLYFKFAIAHQYEQALDIGVKHKLIFDQNVLIDAMVVASAIHIFLLAYSLIVMLNITMGKGTSVFTAIFNFIYISEALFFGSFIFILDWSGIINKFSGVRDEFSILLSQWIYLFIYILGFISYMLTKAIFVEFNSWNREWLRLDRYRKTEDRENAFVFKTWITPGEIRARKDMIGAAWCLIVVANVMDLVDVLKFTDFNVIKYLVLGAGYAIFTGAFLVPYSKWSLFFYWPIFLLMLSVLSFGLYHVQNTAWIEKNYFEYSYLGLFIPFFLTLSSSVKYTWTIRNKEEIQAIVISEFETPEQFQNYIAENQTNEGSNVAEDALNV